MERHWEGKRGRAVGWVNAAWNSKTKGQRKRKCSKERETNEVEYKKYSVEKIVEGNASKRSKQQVFRRLEVEVSLMNKMGGKARKDRWRNRSVERETEL